MNERNGERERERERERKKNLAKPKMIFFIIFVRCAVNETKSICLYSFVHFLRSDLQRSTTTTTTTSTTTFELIY